MICSKKYELSSIFLESPNCFRMFLFFGCPFSSILPFPFHAYLSYSKIFLICLLLLCVLSFLSLHLPLTALHPILSASLPLHYSPLFLLFLSSFATAFDHTYKAIKVSGMRGAKQWKVKHRGERFDAGSHGGCLA